MTMNTPAQTPQPAAQPLPPDVQAASTTSLILEIIFGFFSLLGIGHVYSGRMGLGIGLMVGWWIYMVVAGLLSSVTGGLAACLFLPIYIAVPIISGIQASAYVKKAQATGTWKSVAIVAAGGCLVVIVAVCVLAVFGVITVGALSSMFQSE